MDRDYPDYTECTKDSPKWNADYHAEAIKISNNPEKYRCKTCGREWEP